MLKYTILINTVLIFFVLVDDNSSLSSMSTFENLNKETIFLSNTIEMIKIREKKMQDFNCIPSTTKAILLIGSTGTGKSTLINYLNNVPLVCKKFGVKWVIDLESDNSSLPCEFTISHSLKSSNPMLSSYTPPGNDFSYIEMPGFKENSDLDIEILNAFLVEKIIKNINDFKFLITLDYGDLLKGGENFLKTVNDFSDLLGIFNKRDIENVQKSIGIIVTKVNNDGDSDINMKIFLKNTTLEILEKGINNDLIRKKDSTIIENLISNNQMELFSNPKQKVKLNDFQRNQILSLIDKMVYVDKELIKIKPKIGSSQAKLLFSFVENYYSQIKLTVKKSINNHIDKLFENAGRAIYINEIDTIKNEVHSIKESENQDVVSFTESNPKIFDEIERNQILKDKK